MRICIEPISSQETPSMLKKRGLTIVLLKASHTYKQCNVPQSDHRLHTKKPQVLCSTCKRHLQLQLYTRRPTDSRLLIWRIAVSRGTCMRAMCGRILDKQLKDATGSKTRHYNMTATMEKCSLPGAAAIDSPVNRFQSPVASNRFQSPKCHIYYL